MVSAFRFFEDFQLGTPNLPGCPLHRLPGHGTGTSADHKGGQRNTRDHIAPVLKSVIKHEGGGVLAGHAEVALEDPLPDILGAILRQHTTDDRAGGLFAVGPCQGIACIIGGFGRSKKGSGGLFLSGRPGRVRGKMGRFVDKDNLRKPIRAEQFPVTPDNRTTHRMPQQGYLGKNQ
jgi:hypothetical protein